METLEIKEGNFENPQRRSGGAWLGRFWWDERGAPSMEYSLILALIGMAIIGGVSLFGKGLGEMITAGGINYPKGGSL